MKTPTGQDASPQKFALLAFDCSNRLGIRIRDLHPRLPFIEDSLERALSALELCHPTHTKPVEYGSAALADGRVRIFFCQVVGVSLDPDLVFRSIEQLGTAAELCPWLAAILRGIEPHLIEIPYLHLGENDFIYRFRPEKERNSAIYEQDPEAKELYYSRLCEAIKLLAREQERSAGAPVMLDFGAIRYVIPSHFGFCLGVKNAIERAYETLSANPGRRVFMLSELIHNPFVNSDLLRRGLRYLQTDKGVPYTIEGTPSSGAGGEMLMWDTLNSEDIVVIPAFGATDDDKKRLVRKGIPVCQYDATCMLVEKVWKAARAYGREGYSVVIHGKHEHEETKATFSNTRRYAPSLIVRDIAEARMLGEIILAGGGSSAQQRFEQTFAGRYTPGFDVARHLERIAVVNQTTLLSNETIGIIDYLKAVYSERFGDATRVGGTHRRDTLCYATQVNQDALARSLETPLDAAFIIGGKNSSNTYQLFRLCEKRIGDRAFFIQSEDAIRSEGVVDHYVFPSQGSKVAGHIVQRPLWPPGIPAMRQVLVTGGASCPDGIINQVIQRINSLFPQENLRPIETVITELERRLESGANSN